MSDTYPSIQAQAKAEGAEINFAKIRSKERHYRHSGNIRAALIFCVLKKLAMALFYRQPVEYTSLFPCLNGIGS